MRLYSYAASANCLKVRVLLGLLKVSYELVEVDIFAGGTLSEEFAARNPLRETPVLEPDDGTNLTQSNAILGYLAEDTPWAGGRRSSAPESQRSCSLSKSESSPGSTVCVFES
jgi:glutathione S-transferase